MSEHNIYGVDVQTILTVCEYTYVEGKLLKNRNNNFCARFMGNEFTVEFEKVEVPPIPKLYTYTTHGGEIRNRYEHDFTYTSYVIYTLTGNNWVASVEHYTYNYYSMEWRGAMASGLNPKPIGTDLSKDYLFWGRQGVFVYKDHSFVGDMKSFQEQMIMATFIGRDSELWKEYNY